MGQPDQGVEDEAGIVGGIEDRVVEGVVGDMAEEGLEGAGKKEVERGMAGGQVGDGDAVHWFVELGVEVVEPELVKVAEDGPKPVRAAAQRALLR